MKDLKTTIAGVIISVITAGETLLPYFEGVEEINWAQVIAAIVILVFSYFTGDKKDSGNKVEASTINPNPKPPRPDND